MYMQFEPAMQSNIALDKFEDDWPYSTFDLIV